MININIRNEYNILMYYEDERRENASLDLTRCINRKEWEKEVIEIKLVIIKYLDHVLYRNTSPSMIEKSIRKTVGWVVKETPYSITISWEPW